MYRDLRGTKKKNGFGVINSEAVSYFRRQINIRSLITIWIELKISIDAHSMPSSLRFISRFRLFFFSAWRLHNGFCVCTIPPQKVACAFTLSNCFYVCKMLFMIKRKQRARNGENRKIEDKYDLHENIGCSHCAIGCDSMMLWSAWLKHFSRTRAFICYSGHA